MTVHSALRRSRTEIETMDKKIADMGAEPPISFWSAHGKKDVEADDANAKHHKDRFANIQIPLEQGKKDGPTYERYIKMFKEGTAEEWCVYRATIKEFSIKLGYDKFTRNPSYMILFLKNKEYLDTLILMVTWLKKTKEPTILPRKKQHFI